MIPIISGTQAPFGTFLSAAPQKRPSIAKLDTEDERNDEHLTVEEAKNEEITDTNDNWPMLDVSHLDGNQDTRGEHDSRYGKSNDTSKCHEVQYFQTTYPYAFVNATVLLKAATTMTVAIMTAECECQNC